MYETPANQMLGNLLMNDLHDSADHTVAERINEKYDRLRNAEKAVADFILNMVGDRLEYSITELASRIGVSEATVSRFSKSIGYRGYQDLKLSIVAGMKPRSELPNLPEEISANDTPSEIGAKLAQGFSKSILETDSILSQSALAIAADALCEADRILFMGVGGAASVCLEATHLFAKAGRRAEAIMDDYTQIVAASAVSKGDVIVGISHTGQTLSVARALELAKSANVPAIAITSDRRSPVSMAADATLNTWRMDHVPIPLFGDFVEGRVCQMFIIDLLYLIVLFRAPQGEREKLLRTGSALRDFYFDS